MPCRRTIDIMIARMPAPKRMNKATSSLLGQFMPRRALTGSPIIQISVMMLIAEVVKKNAVVFIHVPCTMCMTSHTLFKGVHWARTTMIQMRLKTASNTIVP